jgi:hypothetical protein
MGDAYKILVGNTEGKRLLGRHRHRREDNITIGLRKIGWKGVEWMHLVQGRDQWQALVNTWK